MPVVAPTAKPKKLSFKEQRELEELPARIAALEKEQAEIAELLSGTDIYVKDAPRVAQLTVRNTKIDEDLMKMLERWEDLSAR